MTHSIPTTASVHHITLTVQDVRRSQQFYTGVFAYYRVVITDYNSQPLWLWQVYR